MSTLIFAFDTSIPEMPVDDFVNNDRPDEGPSAPPSLLDQLMAISRASALEEMASGIAHEINQPLGAITTFAQAGERLLSRPDATIDSVREILHFISKEALSAAAGIQRIRHLFHRDNLDKASCAIQDLVHELTPALQLLARKADVNLTVSTDGEPPQITVDRLRIQQVIYSLVQNAIDASKSSRSGGVRSVRIGIDGDRYGATVNVTDSGGGVAEADKIHIFHPFFTTKPEGTGLGLASARAIVQAHEGSIGYENVAGGARFWIRLPAATESEHE